MKLAAGNNKVYLGSGVETINGSTGNNTFYASTAASAGAAINGGTGKNTLDITGAGTAVMDAADTGLSTIKLAASSSLTLDNESNLTVTGSGADTFILGSGTNAG